MIELFRRNPKFLLWGEMLLLYLAPPLVLFLTDAPRSVLFSFLWVAAGGALAFMRSGRGLSLREIWQGRGWTAEGKRKAWVRFLAILPVLAFTTLVFAPDRFLTFPVERFRLWLAVMLLYPVLSALPQSFLFRSFFFARYEGLFARSWMLIVVNGILFGFAHSLYGNWIAPLFSALAGMIFAGSYWQHRSLKWAMIEHAAYGCAAFTFGIGWFFFKHS